MKTTKIIALVLVAVMMMAIAVAANAASITITSTATPDEAAKETTEYTAWMLLNAEIETAPTQDEANQTGGAVSYYTTSSAAKDALANLFTFTQVGSEQKWYATPVDGLTAEDVVNAFKNKTDAEMTAAFGSPSTGKQTAPAGNATINVPNDGYYFVKSTLGDKIAIQTIGDVTIKTKNSYPGDEKEVEKTDEHAQIGDEINYTLTVDVPSSANDVIVLTDTMTGGLTFKAIDSVQADGADVTYTAAPTTAAAITGNGNKFTITFDKDTVIANKGKTITIKYTAILNNNAVVGTPEKNKLDLKYGNNYEAKPKEVETQTHSFTFDKVDGSTMLTGAEFILTTDGITAIDLVQVTANEVYRVWMSEDGESAKIPDGKIVTAGKTITINGVDSDITYKLVETKEPAGGYNKLDEPKEVKVDAGNSTHIDVENKKGAVLPSTGGIGTKVFYTIGIILILGAGILLVTRRRMGIEK